MALCLQPYVKPKSIVAEGIGPNATLQSHLKHTHMIWVLHMVACSKLWYVWVSHMVLCSKLWCLDSCISICYMHHAGVYIYMCTCVKATLHMVHITDPPKCYLQKTTNIKKPWAVKVGVLSEWASSKEVQSKSENCNSHGDSHNHVILVGCLCNGIIMIWFKLCLFF